MIETIGSILLVFELFLIVNDRARLVTQIPKVGYAIATVVILIGIILIAAGMLSKSSKKPK